MQVRLLTGLLKPPRRFHMVSALPFGFLRLNGLIRSKYLAARLHGSEVAAVSGRHLDAFRTGIVRACCPYSWCMEKGFRVRGGERRAFVGL